MHFKIIQTHLWHRRHAHLTEAASNPIYQATVTRKDNSTTETNIGFAKNDFKSRYRNHTTSFRHIKHRNSTKLSKHIWALKENNNDHFISWCILSLRTPYNGTRKRCNLCPKEKLLIISRPELSSLNKRDELVSSCRHINKALLRNNSTKHLNLPPRLFCKFVKYINDGYEHSWQ